MNMKCLLYIGVCVAVLGFSACSSQQKKGNGDSTSQEAENVLPGEPQRMQVSDITTSFSYRGKEYSSTVVRRPDESLPMVKDEQGMIFVDNRISLRLTCGDKQVVNRNFTKENFALLVDADFLKTALLEGLVFYKTTDEGMIYIASVCYPQSDLYVTLRLTITPDGQIRMEREEMMEDYVPDSIS